MARVIGIFGSGETKPGSRDWKEALRLGGLLAKSGFTVMNGGYGGSMTAVSQGAKIAGGRTVGITTRDFGPSKANAWIDYEKRLPHWQDRMLYLVKNSKASIALPGSLGSLIEIAVSLEMIRKKLIPSKPVILIGGNWKKVFSPYLAKESHAIRNLFVFAASAPEAVAALIKRI